ncbi:MAG: hypothetical protein GX335_10275 [Firmicutes bacterium]|nr:hypothetical protein [Bacillota bacterium]
MKGRMFLAVFLLFVISAGAWGAEGNPEHGLDLQIPALAEIGPYASIAVQRVNVQPNGWWFVWNEGIPGMDFGAYSGEAGFGKVADSNVFVLETNTGVILTFAGESLTHALGDKMLTRYWAWLSRGVDNLPKPYLFLNFPSQIRPYQEIGFFGEAGKAPRKDAGRQAEQYIFDVLEQVAGTNFWPADNWSSDVEQHYGGVSSNGMYAFQVFGFASTDEISSQREGDYAGKIILTVAK